MNIYFAGSIRGGREYVDTYKSIISHLNNYGEVLTEHVASSDISEIGESGLTPQEIYARDIEWLMRSEVFVADVSLPSLGVGFEIAKALELKKRVLCIYLAKHKDRLSAMIVGCPDVVIHGYNSVDDIKDLLDNFLK